MVRATVAVMVAGGLGGCSDCGIPLMTAQHVGWASQCTEMGVVSIDLEPGVEVVELPSLQRAQRVEIRGPDLREVSMPALVEVDEWILDTGAPFLTTLALPRLERTGASVSIDSQRLETVELGALAAVGETLALASGPVTLSLPSLVEAGALSMASITTRTLQLPALETVDDRVDLDGRLVRAELPLLAGDPWVVLGGAFFAELDLSSTTGSPIVEVGREALSGNDGSLLIETGPGSRPTLCVRSAAEIETLSLRGSATLAELSLWQVPRLATVDAPQLTRIQLLETNSLSSMSGKDLAALTALADNLGASHCQN